MSYRAMSNREGNQQRIMEMHSANMSPGVIAAYMTDWKVPMTSQDVQSIINTYESMGNCAVKKFHVQQAIETHKQITELFEVQQPITEEDNEARLTPVAHDCDECENDAQ